MRAKTNLFQAGLISQQNIFRGHFYSTIVLLVSFNLLTTVVYVIHPCQVGI